MTPAERFGAELRRERERAGVTLASIAIKTNVTATHFVALERGDCSRWPRGVYSRAFLRGYAEAIGLHPGQVLSEASQYFSNFHDEGPPVAGRIAEMPSELRMGLAAPGPDWEHRFKAAAVFGLDAGIALILSGAVYLAGGHFWIALTVLFAAFYAASLFRASTIAPRSAFMIARSPATRAVPASAPTGAAAPAAEPFRDDVLEAESI